MKQILCSCRACGKIFDFKYAETRSRKLYDINIIEKICPNCGSMEFENINDRRWLDRYLKFSTQD